nr:hypothetical protein [Tanacetum cinerariifolium]
MKGKWGGLVLAGKLGKWRKGWGEGSVFGRENQHAVDVTKLRFRYPSYPCILCDYLLLRDAPLPLLDMDLLAFIHTPDPTKVKIVEWERVKDDPLLLYTTAGRIVPLLLVVPDRADSELETIADAGGSSHPLKKLKEDHETPSRPSVAGKSRSTVQRLLVGALLNVEAKVDSLVRSSVPVMTAVTITTSMADPVVVVKEKTAKPSLFVIDSSSAGGADPNAGVFQILPEVTFLRLKSAVEEKDELLKAMDKEIENIKAQMVLKEAEAAKAIRLRVEASNFVTVEKSLRDVVNVVNERNTILEKERDALDVKVADLEASA